MLALGLAFGIALGAGNCAAGQIGSGTGSAAGSGDPARARLRRARAAHPIGSCVNQAGQTGKAPRAIRRMRHQEHRGVHGRHGGLRAVSVLGVGETTRIAGATAVQSRVCSDFAPINWYDPFRYRP